MGLVRNFGAGARHRFFLPACASICLRAGSPIQAGADRLINMTLGRESISFYCGFLVQPFHEIDPFLNLSIFIPNGLILACRMLDGIIKKGGWMEN